MKPSIKPEKLLVVELNEFNHGLLKEAADVFNLTHLKHVLQMRQVTTLTDDTYDSGFLEPWVQWVSIHTGVPASVHKIKHLGDVPDLDSKQIWEDLSQDGITSGVWGCMNASRREAVNCQFFLPDPWTFSEPGYPASISRLLDLPRYLSKSYLNLSPRTVIGKLKYFGRELFTPAVFTELLKELPALLKNLVRFKGEHFVFISFADYILTRLFLDYRKKYQPQFSVLFLNSLAHLQHHHWHKKDLKENPRMKLGLQYIDRLVGDLLKNMAPDEGFIFLNGLSQKNTNSEKPWILYRQFDHRRFLNAGGIFPSQVEPHMTHDAHLFFEDEKFCRQALAILGESTIEGQKLFHVETYPGETRKLFYRIDFVDEILDKGAKFKLDGREFLFSDHFKAIVRRTGKHIQMGTAFTNIDEIPSKLYNHELYGCILKFFGRSSETSAV